MQYKNYQSVHFAMRYAVNLGRILTLLCLCSLAPTSDLEQQPLKNRLKPTVYAKEDAMHTEEDIAMRTMCESGQASHPHVVALDDKENILQDICKLIEKEDIDGFIKYVSDIKHFVRDIKLFILSEFKNWSLSFRNDPRIVAMAVDFSCALLEYAGPKIHEHPEIKRALTYTYKPDELVLIKNTRKPYHNKSYTEVYTDNESHTSVYIYNKPSISRTEALKILKQICDEKGMKYPDHIKI